LRSPGEDVLGEGTFGRSGSIDFGKERELGLFITFEGIEGSGKTTQIRRLKRYLTERGIPCVVTREPGGSPIGEKIRNILLNPDHGQIAPLTELLLYEAARSQHVEEVIKPLLKKGTVILCDRFSDASLAYQGYGRGIELELIKKLNRLATDRIQPDVTFLLDCPPRVGLRRAIDRNQRGETAKEDRFERESLSFHRRVRKGYLALAKPHPKRVKLIDAGQGEGKVFETIRQIVDELIHRKAKKR
jgi:dTMP kinase